LQSFDTSLRLAAHSPAIQIRTSLLFRSSPLCCSLPLFLKPWRGTIHTPDCTGPYLSVVYTRDNVPAFGFNTAGVSIRIVFQDLTLSILSILLILSPPPPPPLLTLVFVALHLTSLPPSRFRTKELTAQAYRPVVALNARSAHNVKVLSNHLLANAKSPIHVVEPPADPYLRISACKLR
jgi:hypothetical protein